jgi:ubiquinone/menaquinone biosynthesis C-methylase UbiE
MSDRANTATPYDEVLDREARFHDELAARMDAGAMPPRRADSLVQAILALAGDVRGLRVLDLGCGSGDIALELLRRGADVTGVDISRGMVELARARVELFEPGHADRATFAVADAAATGLDDASFDLVVGKWLLHHVDVERAAAEVGRLLAPGGRGLFVENQGTNPLLRFARKHLVGRAGIPRYGTADEHPLTAPDYERMARPVGSLQLHYPDFFFLSLFSRQVLRNRSKSLRRALEWADYTIYRRVPAARRFSYHVIVELTP